MIVNCYEPPKVEIVVVAAELGTLYSTGIDVPPGEDFGEDEWV